MTSEHGTISRYNNERCRCADCRYAHATYHRAYMAELRRLARIGKAVEQITNPTRKAPTK